MDRLLSWFAENWRNTALFEGKGHEKQHDWFCVLRRSKPAAHRAGPLNAVWTGVEIPFLPAALCRPDSTFLTLTVYSLSIK